ncbi:MAG: DUF4390 domain-containing protein [Proteobacteria bacterium]|nr:DUF4390 domain-containing protein [Pseudomonadota bacterium]
MGLRSTSALALALLLLLPVAPSQGRPPQAYIDGVKLRRGAHADLLVDFRVEGILNERILDTLDSGLPVRFTYWVQVTRPREFLRDQVVADRKLVRILEKDNLKDRFRVTFEDGEEPRDVATLDAAIRTMARVEGVSVLPLAALDASRPLVLRLKAQLQKFQLPFRLHYLFAFVSYWDVETDWYSVVLPATPDDLP